MEIREANISDKNSVLKFCKNTFSWGDYIEKVWSSWLDEGNLFLFEKQSPVGICHAFYSENQIWIEGIRIDPKHRREMIVPKKHAQLSFFQVLVQFEEPIVCQLRSRCAHEVIHESAPSHRHLFPLS